MLVCICRCTHRFQWVSQVIDYMVIPKNRTWYNGFDSIKNRKALSTCDYSTRSLLLISPVIYVKKYPVGLRKNKLDILRFLNGQVPVKVCWYRPHEGLSSCQRTLPQSTELVSSVRGNLCMRKSLCLKRKKSH